MNLQFKPNRHPELDSGSVELEEKNKTSSLRQMLNQVQHDVGR